MVTQTEVNTAFEIGEQRMFDIDEIMGDGMIEHAELSGMMMGALKVHARRCHKSLLEAAIEIAEMIANSYDDEDE